MEYGSFYKVGVNVQKHAEEERATNKECVNHQRTEVDNVLDQLFKLNHVILNHVKDSEIRRQEY